MFPKSSVKTPHSFEQNYVRCPRRNQEKINQLTALGHRVYEMWECEWNQMINNYPQVKQFVDKLDIVTPLNPREAFFGGRTNAIKLYHEVEGDEQIR